MSRGLSVGLHLFPQAEGSHVRPHFADVGQAFLFCAPLARFAPPQRVVSAVGPDGILLFVVDHDFVDIPRPSIRH